MKATLEEVKWVADHGVCWHLRSRVLLVDGMPQYYDDFWEPLWSL